MSQAYETGNGGMMREIKKVFNPAKNMFEAQITEEHVIAEITQRLVYCGFKIYRHKERMPVSETRGADGKIICKNWRGSKSTPGIPDLFGWIPKGKVHQAVLAPIPFYIEAKRPVGGRHRPAQIMFIQDAQADGVIACFAKCWEDVVAEFEKHGIHLPK